MSLGPSSDSTSIADPQRSVSVHPSGTTNRGSDERASRSDVRAASPSATPASKKPSAKPTQPSGGGAVSSSGTCGASFYSDGQKTANGENFDPNAFTAANKTLPFNTRVRVTNQANGKSTVVRINDRGPFVSGRCICIPPPFVSHTAPAFTPTSVSGTHVAPPLDESGIASRHTSVLQDAGPGDLHVLALRGERAEARVDRPRGQGDGEQHGGDRDERHRDGQARADAEPCHQD